MQPASACATCGRRQEMINRAPQRCETLLHGLSGGIERRAGARVVGGARVEDGDEVGHGFAVLRHRTKVALLDDAAHVLGGRGLDPDRMGAGQQQRIGLRIRHDAAGGRDHRPLMLGDHAFEASALVAAEGVLARHLDQQRNGGAIVLLDHAIKLDEGALEMLGEHAAERRLAGPAQSDERDRVGRGRKCRRRAAAARSRLLCPATP